MQGQLIGLVVGLVIGVVLMWLWGRARLGVLQERLEIAKRDLLAASDANAEKVSWVDQAEQHLREAFQALASQALRENSEEFLKRGQEQLKNLVEPLDKDLGDLDSQIRALEQKREGAYGSLEQQLKQLGQAHNELRDTTVGLKEALKSPTVRGRWGEFQLRRIVEMAGMTNHVDFAEQEQVAEGRPDLSVRLPNEGFLPVDAKTPMDAYLAAVELTDGDQRKEKLKAHARAVHDHVRRLSQRTYWKYSDKQSDRAPEVVVMFIPIEACLGAAFEYEPDLLDFAFSQKVLITSPVTLLALLKTVAYGWMQLQLAENAEQIAKEGRLLYDRLNIFLGHLVGMGKSLDGAVSKYNDAVGSWESRVLPAARRLKDLGAGASELEVLTPVEHQPRPVSPAESQDGDGSAEPEHREEA